MRNSFYSSQRGQLPAKYKGFTLTELAIVMGIIGTILGGIWAAAASVHQNSKLAQEQKALVALVQNIRSLYASSQQFKAGYQDLTATIVAANMIPMEMTVGSTGAVTDPMGASVDITTQAGPALGGSTAYRYAFEITFWGVPINECISFMTTATNSSASNNGLIWAYADGVGGVSNIAGADETTWANCATVATPPNVSLQYKLR